MIWFWTGAIGVLLLLIVLVLSSQVHLYLHFNRTGKDDQFHIGIKALFGLIKFKYEVPKLKLQNLKSLIYKRKESTTTGIGTSSQTETEMIDREKIMRYFEQTKVLLKYTEGLTAWAKTSMRLLQCTEFRWTTRVGLLEAPETAVLTGLIWAVKSNIVHLAGSRIRFRTQPVLHVFPLYNRLHFTTEVLAAGQLRAGSAVWAGLKLLRQVAKVKGGLAAWKKTMTGPSPHPEPEPSS